MNLRDTVLKLFFGNVFTAVLEFGTIAAFTQLLGSAAIGSFFLFQATIGMISIPSNLGVDRAAEKQLSAGAPIGEVLTTAVIMKGLLLVPWIVGLLVTSRIINNYIGVSGILPFVLLGLVSKQGRQLLIRALAGQLRVEKAALLRVLGNLTWMGVGLALIYMGWAASAVIAAFIVGDMVVISGALSRMELAVSQPSYKRARKLVSFGRYIFIGSVGGFVYSWMDITILRLFSISTGLIGAYEIAWRVAGLGMLLTGAIRESIFPKISEWHANENIAEIEKALSIWIQPGIFLTFPALAGAIVLGKTVLTVLFDTNVIVAYPLMLIFMVEKIFRSVQMILSPSLFAIDRPEFAYRGSVVAIGLNLLLNIVLIPVFGIVGAAIATTLSATASAAVSIQYLRQFVSIKVPFWRLLWSAIASIAMAVVIWSIRSHISGKLIQLIIGVPSGIMFYLFFLLANKKIRRDLGSILRQIFG